MPRPLSLSVSSRLLSILGARTLVASMAVVIATGTLGSGSVAVSEEASLPVALIGTTNDVPVEAAEFRVELWPRDDIDRQLQAGGKVPVLRLPPDVVDAVGTQFLIRLDPASIPVNYINDDGRVDISVRVSDSVQNLVGFTFTTVALLSDPNVGSTSWIDPLNPLAEGEPVGANSEIKPVEVSVTMMPQPATPPLTEDDASAEASCPSAGWYYEYSSTRQVSIAHTFVPDGTISNGSAFHATGRNLKEGVAFISEYNGTGWRRSGTKAFRSGFEMTYDTNSAMKRTYRIYTVYGRYKYIATQSNGEYCYVTERVWKPRLNTGGTATESSTVGPSWKGRCTPSAAGAWKRDSSYGETYRQSGGVIINDIIGFNLWSERGYYSNAWIRYYVIGDNKQLCGNNHEAALATHVKLAFR